MRSITTHLGLPIDQPAVTQNAARMQSATIISTHGFGNVEGRDRVVRWNDSVHASVQFRPSVAGTHHNNAPDNVMLLDDQGKEVGRFKRA